jgi:adenosylcobinamide-GDP ribazoletransferase
MIVRGIITAFAMFSQIPMPKVDWDKINMKYTLAALPLVGAVIGGLCWVWLKFSSLGIILTASVMTFIPVLITGGIHLDGFADTVDALSSHAPPEKKREILKDPHTGAFAVIWTAIYLIVFFALCTEIKLTYAIITVPIMSRCAGAFCGIVFKSSSKGVFLYTLKSSASKISIAVLILLFVAGAIFAPISALFMIICGFYIYHISKKEFGGMSGDLAGFLISICEIFGMAGIVLCQLL